MDFGWLKSIIEKNNTFVITTHLNPDADAIGSQLALYFSLKKLGKTVYCINYSPTPFNLKFLDSDNVISEYNESEHDDIILSSDILFILDLNQATRVKKMADVIYKFERERICIDHHQDPDNLATHFYTDLTASATSEILYNFISETKLVEIDFNIANCLYAGIMTDTGSFRYERTTFHTHDIASELLKAGVVPNDVFEEIFDKGRMERLKLLGKALQSITRIYEDQLCYMTIHQKDLEETGSLEMDVDGFVNFTLTVAGIKIGLLFFEMEDGAKVSFRSKGDIPINKLAGEYGGGGHLNAAGARIYKKDVNMEFDAVVEKVLAAAKKFLY